MMRRVLIGVLFSLLVGPAWADMPPDAFLDQPVFVPSDTGGSAEPVHLFVSVRALAAQLADGAWEPGEAGTWVHRSHARDGELTVVFQAAQSGYGVLLARATVGEKGEIPAGELHGYFAPIAEAARSAPTPTPPEPAPAVAAPRPAPSQSAPSQSAPSQSAPSRSAIEAGPDLAAMALGHDADSMLDILPIQNRFHRLMGGDAFARAQYFAAQGPQRAERVGELVRASGCLPRSCRQDQVHFIMDHAGGAWASLTQNGATAYYGSPPPAIRRLLAP
jgi:hypothetical protein